MLKRISITNYLLIDSLELDLRKGFTTITGETGSGKSILIGALGLAMGERADAGVARDATKRCVIELEVEVKKLGRSLVFAEAFTFPVAMRRMNSGMSMCVGHARTQGAS